MKRAFFPPSYDGGYRMPPAEAGCSMEDCDLIPTLTRGVIIFCPLRGLARNDALFLSPVFRLGLPYIAR